MSKFIESDGKLHPASGMESKTRDKIINIFQSEYSGWSLYQFYQVTVYKIEVAVSEDKEKVLPVYSLSI
ncbi:hypothetical protein [uncultured Nostoc sp.]|uniref:hypothetical protein n=1 Tax=uncultured Nostoc sp. TaxID=340711 RepID=UPI0035CC0193